MSRTDTRLTRTSGLEVGLLLVAVAAPLAPAPWGALALAALTAAWWAWGPPRRELLTAGPALVAAVLLLAAGWVASRPAARDREAWVEVATGRYAELWAELDAGARMARRQVGAPPAGREQRLEAFGRLSERVAPRLPPRTSVLLVDRDGEAQAWAGTGLLHEPDPVALPVEGRLFYAGFSAVTLLTVEPVEEGRRPWRVVVGRSLPNDRLPFPPPGGEAAEDFRWTLVPAGSPSALPDSVQLAPPELPAMVIAPAPSLTGAPAMPALWRRAAWGALAFALVALAVLRGVGMALAGDVGLRRGVGVTLLAAAGAAAWSLAAAVSLPAVAALVVGIALVAVGLYGGGVGSPRAGAVAGAVAALVVTAAVWLYQWLLEPAALGDTLPGGAEDFCLRLAAVTATFGLFGLAVRRTRGRPQAGARWAVAAILALVAAGGVADYPVAALALLAAGGAGVGWWLHGRRLVLRFTSLAVLLVMAALAAGAAWEVAYRDVLRRRLVSQYLPQLAPPAGAAVTDYRRQMEEFLSGLDLARLAPRPATGMDRQDLAYSVWRESPLARDNALSALVLTPADGSPPSVFSFGMPLADSNEVDWEAVVWKDLHLPAWDGLRLHGEATVTALGWPWGTVRWWLAPRPGFRLGGRQDVEQVLVELLKGAPGDLRAPSGLPEPALYALYPPQGRALVSPWRTSPPVPEELAARLEAGPRATAVVHTPGGLSWAFARAGDDGYEVLYLPRLGFFAALEEAGTVAASVVLFLTLTTLTGLLLALPRPAFRDLLRRTVRSYSKRLVLVYTTLLLVPLLLLNFVLLRTVEASLRRDQEARGEQALIAAQRSVLPVILSPEPGFAFSTALDDEYFKELSRLVDHDVNLYFASKVLASSTRELFTGGLLPRRIPGEIYARLALLGFGIYSRTAQVVDRPYLELYAPVIIPDEPDEEPRLFLSVPLLAQQEEAAHVLAELRRRALVASTALFALLLAVGGRLARNFTTPIMELVEGTRRIAAGAPSLELAPTELELAALVEAVDEMAGRIAESRRELLREKGVVEGMVENITSGVVSLDGAHRVMMHNRVAAEMLGAGVGDDLGAVLAGRPRLAPVADFLAAAPGRGDGGEPARETVRLAAGDEVEREWTLVWVPLPGHGEPSSLLVVEDVTEVFRGQRLAAWAEMARIIAHEIKNPLTPVRLSAEHMRQVWATDPEHFGDIFERCTTNILHQVDELQEIASEFSTYSRIPRIEVKRADLRQAMDELMEAYRAAPPPGVEVLFDAPGEPLMARFDARLLSRAVRNLLENAVRASGSNGRVELRVATADGWASIVVADSGPGVPPELLARVFDPYFSTHDAGTGLGLPIARRIAEEHGGEIAARNRSGGGLEVEIKIPMS